jgi:hypothetical protein
MEIPFEISYDITIMSASVQQATSDGWDKINYKPNTHDIIRSRFPGTTNHIPGLDEVFEKMAISMESKTPLEEFISKSIINDRKHSDLSKLKESK